MKKQNILCVFTAVLISIAAIILSYNLLYLPMKQSVAGLQKKNDEITALYERYKKSDRDIKKWEETIEKNGGALSLPSGVSCQSQIAFVKYIENRFGFEAVNLRFAAKKVNIATGNNIDIWAKSMTFDYRVGSLQSFCKMIDLIRSEKGFPSSVSYFTILIDKDGSVHGDIHILNYYIA